MILEEGSDLWVGPDSDGLCNFSPTQPECSHHHTHHQQHHHHHHHATSNGHAAGVPASPGAVAAPCAAAAAAAAASSGLGDEVQLPPCRLDTSRLLDSVQIPASMPEAHVPHGVTSVPKPFQLQVWCAAWVCIMED
jgi:hypothetical protein